MTTRDRIIKRAFDLVMSAVGLVFLWPIIGIGWLIARKDTGESGFFLQERVGQNGQIFRVVKLRTMISSSGTTVTTANDVRITRWGAFLRRWKLDELPQLWNVLLGKMSFVGPRPDVPGYSDRLTGNDRRLLDLKPGITGPATLKYRDEEQILAAQDDPVYYNDTIIWPDKVRINLQYLDNWSLGRDVQCIIQTVRG